MVELAGTYEDAEKVLATEESKIVLRNLLNYVFLKPDHNGRLVKFANHSRNLGMSPEYALAKAIVKLTKET